MVEAVRTTCAYCGVGCGIRATVTGERSVEIAGDPDHPANRGRLCSKGTHLGETVGLEGRLLHPMIGSKRAIAVLPANAHPHTAPATNAPNNQPGRRRKGTENPPLEMSAIDPSAGYPLPCMTLAAQSDMAIGTGPTLAKVGNGT